MLSFFSFFFCADVFKQKKKRRIDVIIKTMTSCQ